MTIRLSRRARADLEDIRDYTIRIWGRAQWLRYYRGMVHAFEAISENPTAGQARDLFGEGMRSLPCGQHLIFFAPVKAAGGRPVILRIVHQRRYLPALDYYDDIDRS